MRILRAIIIFSLLIGKVIAQNNDKGYTRYQLDSIKYLDKNIPPGRFQVLPGQFYPNWKPHLGKGLLPLPKYYQWKQKMSTKGFDFLFIVSPEFQYGNLNNKWHGNSEQDLIIQWRLNETQNNYSKFLFWGLNIIRFTSTTPSQMSSDHGLTVGTIGGADPEVFWMLGTFYFEQALLKQRLKIRVGHLFTNLFLSTNKYMIDDRETYINGLLNSPSGVQWTSQKSLGLQVQFDGDLFYGILGFQDQKSDPRYPDFSSFADGKFVYFGELGVLPGAGTAKQGKYSVTANYNTEDASGPSGYGVVVNAQQDLNTRIGLFGRYGQSFERFGEWNRAFTAGVAFNKVFGWDYDQISLAYLQGNPSDAMLSRNDAGLNIYYKVLLTYRADFTLDSQFYFDRSKASDGDSRKAFLLAARLRFML